MDCAFEAADVVAHLDEPVDRVELGQRMIITRSGMPVGALVPFAEEARQRRPSGLDRGRINTHDDVADPIPEVEEWLDKPSVPVPGAFVTCPTGWQTRSRS